MDKINLSAQSRVAVGSGLRALRNAGFVPGVVYGHNFQPLTVQVPVKDFDAVYKEAGQSTIVYLDLEGQSYPTIIHDVARNAVSDQIIHADFYKVRLDEKITANIPIVFSGESPAVKDFSGILVKNLSELEVEAFPQDLPHEITVDISVLKNLNDHIMVKDLKLSDKVEVKSNLEDTIVLVQEPISEEALKADLETQAVTAPEDVEVIKKEKTEGEESEEGESTEKASA